MPRLRSISRPLGAEAALLPTVTERSVQRGSVGAAGPFDSERGASRLLVRGKIPPIERPPQTALETVIGSEDRTRIVDTELTPWRMICSLAIEAGGRNLVGTGWFAGPRTVITAGHCVYDPAQMGGWADTITVRPGRDGGHEPFTRGTTNRYSTVDLWLNDPDPDFDYAAIHLDEPLGDQVGAFAYGVLPDADLESLGVNVSGYPISPGLGRQQWFHVNRVLHVGERRLYYDVDTKRGQSGAPVWVYEDQGAEPVVVGIHAYGVGGTAGHLGIEANSAPRIVPEVLAQIREWVATDGN